MLIFGDDRPKVRRRKHAADVDVDPGIPLGRYVSSQGMAGQASEPGGVKEKEQASILNSENERLRLQLQRVQGQLTQQHVYQVGHRCCHIQHLAAYK